LLGIVKKKQEFKVLRFVNIKVIVKLQEDNYELAWFFIVAEMLR
jgi:hypothetical protein